MRWFGDPRGIPLGNLTDGILDITRVRECTYNPSDSTNTDATYTYLPELELKSSVKRDYVKIKSVAYF